MHFDPSENRVVIEDALRNWLFVMFGLTAIVMFVSLMTLVIINLLSRRGLRGFSVFFSEYRAIIWHEGSRWSGVIWTAYLILAASMGYLYFVGLKSWALIGLGIATYVVLIPLPLFVSISPRRVWALTRLTYLEAYRRKALGVFVVFALLFMFAGWFMGDAQNIRSDQVKVYISFVLTTISWLIFPVVLILSCFGIPEDIRIRSIHTVVTKPARRMEIVLGRMLGISLIGLVVLSFMSVVGYIWIVRQTPASLHPLLTCRVPVYGQLRFIDRDGQMQNEGINVGDIWAYRSYIEGASKARAIWRFNAVSESMLDAEGNLNLENSFSAFRSYKGDMTRQLYYDLKLINVDSKLTYQSDPQAVNENRTKLDRIPRKITIDAVQYDLIKDFVSKDKGLYIEVSCIDREQYIGMARPDLYIRMPDNSFLTGYAKAILGIAFIIVLVSMMGVAASTFVKGPIAMILTAIFFLLSGQQTHEFMSGLVSGKLQGGGPLESIYRLVAHLNPTVELPANPAFKVVKAVDTGPTSFLWLCKQIIPQTQSFNMTEFVANGFDVPFFVSILPSFLVMAAFFLPCVMQGYFALRIRELESK